MIGAMIDAAKLKEWAEHECPKYGCVGMESFGHAQRRELAIRIGALEESLRRIADYETDQVAIAEDALASIERDEDPPSR